MSLVLGAIAAGILIALLVMLTGFDPVFGQSGRRRATDYRTKRRNILERMEGISARIRLLAAVVAEGSPENLASLERLAASLELIVVAFARLSPFGTDPSQLDSAQFLVTDCEERAAGMEVRLGLRAQAPITRMASLIRGGLARAAGRAASGGGTPDRGCYFCSRPFHLDLENFAQVKVKLDGVTRDVFSCGPCKDNLEETKKIKVLYFLTDGQPTHWSQVPGYVPLEAYWNLNRNLGDVFEEAQRSKGQLRLVDTKPDRFE